MLTYTIQNKYKKIGTQNSQKRVIKKQIPNPKKGGYTKSDIKYCV